MNYRYLNVSIFKGIKIFVITQIISPLIAAGSAFPGVMILEYYKTRIRTIVEKILIKLDMNKDLVYSVELKDRISK